MKHKMSNFPKIIDVLNLIFSIYTKLYLFTNQHIKAFIKMKSLTFLKIYFFEKLNYLVIPNYIS